MPTAPPCPGAPVSRPRLPQLVQESDHEVAEALKKADHDGITLFLPTAEAFDKWLEESHLTPEELLHDTELLTKARECGGRQQGSAVIGSAWTPLLRHCHCAT